MADSTVNLDMLSPSQSQKEVTANALFDAASPATIFGRRASACAGLVFGYYGGRVEGSSVPNGTVTATGSNTNYVVAHRTTYAVTISTANTNWNDTATYGRMYKLTAGASTISAYEDHRFGPSGVLVPTVTIADASITNAKLADMAAHTFKGNNTGAPGEPLDLTATEATAELDELIGDAGSGGLKGLVPAPAAGDAAAGKFLKADGTWTAPAGGGGGSSIWAAIIFGG